MLGLGLGLGVVSGYRETYNLLGVDYHNQLRVRVVRVRASVRRGIGRLKTFVYNCPIRIELSDKMVVINVIPQMSVHRTYDVHRCFTQLFSISV